MNKKVNVLKVGLALAAAVMVTGCASGGVVSNKMANNKDKLGIIYGVSGIAADSVLDICKAINNKDYRCADAESYKVAAVISKVGFADGKVGINALIKKDFPGIEKLNYQGSTGDKDAPYVKAKVIPGQLGEIVEIVSTDGDGKCHWSGMPRAGGTVCPAYNWDYRKDNQAAIVF